MIQLTATPESRQDVAELAAFFAGLNSPTLWQKSELSDAMRAIFGQVFENEGPSIKPWHDLAPQTQIERVLEGFAPRHPIHVRFDDFRSSYINLGNSDHIEEYTSHAGGWRLEIGSGDWRVPRLEGILDRPVTLLGDSEENEIGDTLDRMFRQMADDMDRSS